MKLRFHLALCLALGACSSGEPIPNKSGAPETAAATPHATAPGAAIAPKDVVVSGMMVNQPLSPESGDPVRGAEVMTTRKLGNCVACHKVSALEAQAPFHGEIGPSLDGAGSRWQEGQLRALIVNAKTYFPQTVMPAYYRTEGLSRVRSDVAGEPILTAQQVEDVVAFLKTLK